MRSWLRVGLCALLLTGCGSTQEDQPQRPTTVTMSLVAQSRVNSDMWGQAAPIEIQVFELSDDSMFMSSSYDELRDDDKKALKSNFVKRYDYVLTPDQFKFINEIEVDSDTRYIGVMANFSDIEKSDWKKTVKVSTLNREYHLLMLLGEHDVQLKRVE